MKTDAQLKKDVESELEWDPAINAAHIGVLVENGVVTLTGHLGTYGEKFLVERAIQRVQGVRALAVELDVKLAPSHKRSDSEIAAAAEDALTWSAQVPAGISLRVEQGWITLKGDVEWDYQRHAAARAVRSLTGVVGVSNDIEIRQRPAHANVVAKIRDALVRQAEQDAQHIDVAIDGSEARLRGTVHSWAERSAAQGAAWSAVGVTSVVNELKVLN
ncbi:BON domain-containing protein [Variovorax sp. YR216]|uniref:BON domain-containing protein n=1 Tax=Variovorax sp. YR216 TaxID=1882828 RepID=UPI0008954A6A|nr:BON domain-containing protein [Variovorax sp. YR216]SEA55068.1 Osmotically-inducible protein OsmY, contains BON domain [Variovorax sp. YR216]